MSKNRQWFFVGDSRVFHYLLRCKSNKGHTLWIWKNSFLSKTHTLTYRKTSVGLVQNQRNPENLLHNSALSKKTSTKARRITNIPRLFNELLFHLRFPLLYYVPIRHLQTPHLFQCSPALPWPPSPPDPLSLFPSTSLIRNSKLKIQNYGFAVTFYPQSPTMKSPISNHQPTAPNPRAGGDPNVVVK